MKYIRRKSISSISSIHGSVCDTMNVVDKTTNAPSLNLVSKMAGVPYEGIIAYDGIEVPNGYEQVENPDSTRLNNIENILSIKNTIPIYLGNYMMSAGKSGTTLVTKQFVMGCSADVILTSLSYLFTIPSGYHIEYIITCNGYTSNNTYVNLYLNDYKALSIFTYGNTAWRKAFASKFFKASDITQKTGICNYSQHTGIQLEYEVTGTAAAWAFEGVILHAYLIKD